MSRSTFYGLGDGANGTVDSKNVGACGYGVRDFPWHSIIWRLNVAFSIAEF